MLTQEQENFLKLVSGPRAMKHWRTLHRTRRSWLSDKQFVITAVRMDGLVLMYVSDTLKDSIEVVTTAVRQNGRALAYASTRLRDDKDVVSTAVNNLGIALVYASKTMQNDPEVVTIAVQNYGSAIKYASEELRANKQIALTAIRNDTEAFQYISVELQNDPDIILEMNRKRVNVKRTSKNNQTKFKTKDNEKSFAQIKARILASKQKENDKGLEKK